MKTPDARTRELAHIHVGAKHLRLDRDAYVALIRRVSAEQGHEVSSSGDLDDAGRRAVITEMARLGFRAARTWADRPRDCDRVPMLGKIEALLADAGREWAYAHAVAKRMFGSQRVEWLNPDQLRRVIAALEIDARRRRAANNKGAAHEQ